ncbi:hypothetical protein [Nocardioides donggukensis]|uniref:Uncharacterized protein n=1 Tax=Nocardioides donggukensis TaxID=2774019 RepID=A0A927Q167_9ACTN|nr:hypothetical protein [Nocardioides donggukensis]MBD8868456.1 hypothetical protein [Nocardioides donggukensis]
MTRTRRTRAAPPRALVATVVVALVLGSALAWFGGADERRVNGACDTWLVERAALRTVLSEAEEAVGRAEAAGDRDVSRHFNDLDRDLASLERWEAVGPGTQSSLSGDGGASRIERGAESAFGYLNSAVTGLHQRLDDGDPTELAQWVPEAGARFQNVDDTCLAAAR